ncbi:hypothetical protein Bca101_035212 [Brassica carinata]
MAQRKSTKRNSSDTQTNMHRNHASIKTTSHQGKRIAKTTLLLVFSIFISACLLSFLGCFDYVSLKQVTTIVKPPVITLHRFPHQCGVVQNQTQSVSENGTNNNKLRSSHSRSSTCPTYFRWIHEDLRPWREIGVTRRILEKARRKAHFRVVILDGKVYAKKYRRATETRDTFTLWGIVQLLRWYPGRLPDLELLFDADDRPTVRSRDYRGEQHPGPPPVFRYCSNDASLDIVFPDWSFWGWAELNIKPWAKSLVAIEEGNKMTQWEDRVPYAYWRGNPKVARTRRELLSCNVSDQEDWNTRLYINDWATESKEGFKNSNLENQCTHRYKIYVEGWAWSVSEKDRGKCRSLKHAVHWGNTHLDQIGEEGSRYIREEVNMEHVYDYMFHLMNEYVKLLRFKPEIPRGAKEITPDSMGCPAKGRWRDFMAESLVMSPSEVSPCDMSLPHSPLELKEVLERKANLTRQVELCLSKWQNSLDSKISKRISQNVAIDTFVEEFQNVVAPVKAHKMENWSIADLVEEEDWCIPAIQEAREKRDKIERERERLMKKPPPLSVAEMEQLRQEALRIIAECGLCTEEEIKSAQDRTERGSLPEMNIKEWNQLSKAISEGIKKVKWEERKPYAYWKGNPGVARIRRDLMRCHDPTIHLIHQNWKRESRIGFRTSNLAHQCTHSNTGACEMPPPFEEDELKTFLENKRGVEKEVEKWGNEYWEEQKKSLQH